MNVKLAIHFVLICLCGVALIGSMAAGAIQGMWLSGGVWGMFFGVLIGGLWFTRGMGGQKVAMSPPAGEPFASLVLLNRRPRALDRTALAEKIGQAWGDERAGSIVVEGEPPTFIVQGCGHSFAVQSFGMPYFSDPKEVASSIEGSGLKELVATHEGWMSVDLLGSYDPPEGDRVYRLIGLLLAELADEQTVGVYWPDTGELRAYHAAAHERLAAGRGVEAMSEWEADAVEEIAGDDPRLHATAGVAARRRWPEFVEAFENRSGPQTFWVKAWFGEGSAAEALWMMVSAIENDVVYGVLINRGAGSSALVAGARVNVAVERVVDWMYSDRGTMQGGFLVELLRRGRRTGRRKDARRP